MTKGGFSPALFSRQCLRKNPANGPFTRGVRKQSTGNKSIPSQDGQVAKLAEAVAATVGKRWGDDEAANQFTHGVGLILSLIGGVILMAVATSNGNATRIVACGVYVSTLIAVYAASTLMHTFRSGYWRDFFQMVDQICIFLMIAGSFTPFAVVYLQTGWQSSLLSVIWTTAGVGALARILSSATISIPFYLVTGWIPVATVDRMAEVGNGGGLGLALAGGLAYTIGTLFLAYDHRVWYFHAVWHLFVIFGSACHFLFVLWYVAM